MKEQVFYRKIKGFEIFGSLVAFQIFQSLTVKIAFKDQDTNMKDRILYCTIHRESLFHFRLN